MTCSCGNPLPLDMTENTGKCVRCMLQESLGYYAAKHHEYHLDIANMPKDFLSLDKQSLIDSDRTWRDYE